MASRALISLSLCLAAALRLAGATVQPDKINGLLNNSPFGQSRAGATAGSGTNDPLEFRAVLEDKGGMMFSVYDTAAHRSIWVQLKDSTNGFAVNEYDAARESITVDFHGRSLILPIKRAPAVALAQTARPNVPGALGGGPSSSQAGSTPVDQQRMQQIQEEIRRRRALREQPSANASLAGTQGGPQLVPYNNSGSQTGPMLMPTNNSTGSQTGPQPTPSNSPGPQPVPSNSSPPQPAPAKP
jgi:hypothetical protein